MAKERTLSLQIASCTPAVAQQLLDVAIERFNAGATIEEGKLIHGDEPGSGCAMLYIWPAED